MKRTLLLLAVGCCLFSCTAQVNSDKAQADPYKAQMENIEAKGKAIITEYRSLTAADPNAEQPATKERIGQLELMMDSVEKEQLALTWKIIRENQQNNIPAPYIKDAMYELGYEGLKEALNPAAAYYNHPDLDRPKLLLANYEKRKPGTTFHELTMKDMDDQEVKLSQWAGRGNYVLVDFWASWCGPCRQEMPNVVANYKKYHAKGFEVVGVSFDQKKEPWVKAVQQMDMQWPQMSDLQGWKCAAAGLYGVSSIPANVLLDPKGTIIAMDLRGAALGDKLRELYGGE